MADRDMLTNIREIQNSKRHQTMMERWLRERKHTQFVEEKIMAQPFYEEFIEFEKARNNGKSDTNITKFGRDILDIARLVDGLELIKDKNSKGKFYKITYTKSTELGA
jgi:hypothetical protein